MQESLVGLPPKNEFCGTCDPRFPSATLLIFFSLALCDRAPSVMTSSDQVWLDALLLLVNDSSTPVADGGGGDSSPTDAENMIWWAGDAISIVWNIPVYVIAIICFCAALLIVFSYPYDLIAFEKTGDVPRPLLPQETQARQVRQMRTLEEAFAHLRERVAAMERDSGSSATTTPVPSPLPTATTAATTPPTPAAAAAEPVQPDETPSAVIELGGRRYRMLEPEEELEQTRCCVTISARQSIALSLVATFAAFILRAVIESWGGTEDDPKILNPWIVAGLGLAVCAALYLIVLCGKWMIALILCVGLPLLALLAIGRIVQNRNVEFVLIGVGVLLGIGLFRWRRESVQETILGLLLAFIGSFVVVYSIVFFASKDWEQMRAPAIDILHATRSDFKGSTAWHFLSWMLVFAFDVLCMLTLWMRMRWRWLKEKTRGCRKACCGCRDETDSNTTCSCCCLCCFICEWAAGEDAPAPAPATQLAVAPVPAAIATA